MLDGSIDTSAEGLQAEHISFAGSSSAESLAILEASGDFAETLRALTAGEIHVPDHLINTPVGEDPDLFAPKDGDLVNIH